VAVGPSWTRISSHHESRVTRRGTRCWSAWPPRSRRRCAPPNRGPFGARRSSCGLRGLSTDADVGHNRQAPHRLHRRKRSTSDGTTSPVGQGRGGRGGRPRDADEKLDPANADAAMYKARSGGWADTPSTTSPSNSGSCSRIGPSGTCDRAIEAGRSYVAIPLPAEAVATGEVVGVEGHRTVDHPSGAWSGGRVNTRGRRHRPRRAR